MEQYRGDAQGISRLRSLSRQRDVSSRCASPGWHRLHLRDRQRQRRSDAATDRRADFADGGSASGAAHRGARGDTEVSIGIGQQGDPRAGASRPGMECGASATAHAFRRSNRGIVARARAVAVFAAVEIAATAGDRMTAASGMRRGLTRYGDAQFSLFLRKAFIKALGYTDDALARPIVGITNTYSDFNPCHATVPQLIAAVKRGVMLAGALPMEFPTISIHESFAYPTSMYLRNLMALDTEEMIRAQPVDAVVLIGGCDT